MSSSGGAGVARSGRCWLGRAGCWCYEARGTGGAGCASCRLSWLAQSLRASAGEDARTGGEGGWRLRARCLGGDEQGGRGGGRRGWMRRLAGMGPGWAGAGWRWRTAGRRIFTIEKSRVCRSLVRVELRFSQLRVYSPAGRVRSSRLSTLNTHQPSVRRDGPRFANSHSRPPALAVHTPAPRRPPMGRKSTNPHHASWRARLWYGSIEWMMVIQSSPRHKTNGIESLSQLLSIMPWFGMSDGLIAIGRPWSGWSGT